MVTSAGAPTISLPPFKRKISAGLQLDLIYDLVDG